MDLQSSVQLCSQPNCADGSGPEQDSMVVDAAGHIYGTAYKGGTQNTNCIQGSCGVVFELTPTGDWATWTERVLDAFCPAADAVCADGATPDAGVIKDDTGNLVGTTVVGGANNQNGVVFALSPNAAANGQTTWAESVQYTRAATAQVGPRGQKALTEQVLYSFCAQGGANCTDSGGGGDALTMLAPGRIYTTTYGGGAQGWGTVVELTR
jgi:hypothetical protein